MGEQIVEPLAIRVVIVTMFDPPDSAIGWPSELARWVERVPLPERVPFPLGERDLRINRDKSVLAVVTGVGNTKAAASIMALGLDPRFDLSRAYWLVAGIAGANPAAMSLGSAAWIDWVVDGDLAHDIDAREIPAEWPTGRLPLGKSAPYQQPVSTLTAIMAWRLDPALVEWAYRLTRPVELSDGATVLTGAVLASSSLWHGALLNRWAEAWVNYWTDGQARFVASAMEDSGIVSALHALARGGRVDSARLLILRTASNYNVPPAGVGAAESLGGEMRDGFSAYVPALETAWRIGSVVVDIIATNWDRYSTERPT
ncbi:MAG TPA: purine nucleoside permease [Stellaceae bacterium]|nr:purine nucleoside permease [Stellaceae bacterium]